MIKNMKKTNKKFLIFLTVIFVFIIGFSCVLLINYFKTPLIDKTLKKDAYSYLPVEAKNYLIDNYNKTGNILLTEKNKKVGELYLNPEYVEYLTLSEKEKSKLDDNDVPRAAVAFEDYSKYVSEDVTLPSSFDLRNVSGKNYVSPVRNQGSFGLCWAFSSAEAFETHTMYKSGQSYVNSSQQISERQIDYATSSSGFKNFTAPYKNLISRSLGTGGRFDSSTPAFASGSSIFSYNDFKAYNDTDTEKMEVSEVLRTDKSQYELMESTEFSLNTYRESSGTLTDAQKESRAQYLQTVKSAIKENGSLYVGVHFSEKCMHKDSASGLQLLDIPSTATSNTNCTFTNDDFHALNIVGWDDNKTYSYCKTGSSSTGYYHYACSSSPSVSGKGVWIVRNSWGSTYSYIYIAYDSILSELDSITEVRKTSEKDWDNAYYAGSNSINYYYTSKTYYASNFRIVGNEKLLRVKAYTLIGNLDFDVNVKDKDGVVHKYEKFVDHAGLFYIDIDDGIEINSNSTLQVVAPKNSFIDSFSVFTENVDKNPYIDLSPIADTKITSGTKRYYFNTKNVGDGKALLFKFYDSKGNDISSLVTIGDKTNIISQNGVNASITFGITTLGSYTMKVFDGDSLLGECKFIVNSMSGTGTSTNPFVITSPTQFNEIRYGLNSHYVLTNNLDFSSYTSGTGSLNKQSSICSDGYGFEAIDGFTGSINGNGKIISNLRQNNYLTCLVSGDRKVDVNYGGNGIFSNVYGNVTIKDLTINDSEFNCSGGSCGVLISNYKESISEDTSLKTFTINNIGTYNIKMNGYSNLYDENPDIKKVLGGGLLGNINATHSNVNINNVYVGYNLVNSNIYNKGLIASNIIAKDINIHDIQLTGKVVGNIDNSNETSIFNNRIDANNIIIDKVLSTVKGSYINSNLFGELNYVTNTMSNIKTIKNNDKSICPKVTDCSSITNLNEYNPLLEFDQFSNDTNYSTWSNFSTSWRHDTDKLPFLKIINYLYSSISDISITQSLDVDYNINNYITPNSMLTKNVITSVDDESVLTIDDNGRIDILSTGSTNVTVKSLFDGSINNITITVAATPHYTILLDSNGSNEDSVYNTIPVGSNYTLPSSPFINGDCIFVGWNTERDGSGIFYSVGDSITSLDSNQYKTLYAQWVNLNNPNDLISDVYNIDNVNKYIDLIGYNTKLNDYISKINTNGYRIVVETKNINGVEYLFTGSKTKVYYNDKLKNEYTNIVRGDVNGNAIIDIIDYIRIRKDIMDMEKLSGIYLKAADMNQNNIIDIIDYIRIRKIIMGEG